MKCEYFPTDVRHCQFDPSFLSKYVVYNNGVTRTNLTYNKFFK